jgi:hypothetical protein
MRTRRRVKHKARGGSVRPPKREAEGRASANADGEKSKRFFEGRDIEESLGQLLTANPQTSHVVNATRPAACPSSMIPI